MPPHRRIALNCRIRDRRFPPRIRGGRRANRRSHSKGATFDALLAKVGGPTEYVRGALAVDNAVASCPIKSRGSVQGDQAQAKNPSQLSAGTGWRRRFSCICKAPASWKLKSALGEIHHETRPPVNAEIAWVSRDTTPGNGAKCAGRTPSLQAAKVGNIGTMLTGKRILLVVSGGIAAYKALELIRRLRERGAAVRCILTKGGAEFVTALSLAALSEGKVYSDL